MTKYYLAGPMQGIPQFNFPAFFEAAAALRDMGFTIVSPAEIDNADDHGAALQSPDGDPNNRAHMNNKTWGDFLARDVKIVADEVDGLVMMPNWERSKGARLEAFVGLAAKKTFAVYYPEFKRVSYVSSDFIREIIRGNMP